VYEQITDLRLRSQGADETVAERLIRSVRLVADVDGEVPTAERYREVSKAQRATGEDLATTNELLAFFRTWRLVREAAELAQTTSARRIEARFRSRRVAKVWRYSEDVLGATLIECAATLGDRAPTVAEFEWWREGRLQAARAAGDDALHLPSPNPYRKSWKTWERALEHFGFDQDARDGRFQQG
jgi:hypothetical protein